MGDCQHHVSTSLSLRGHAACASRQKALVARAWHGMALASDGRGHRCAAMRARACELQPPNQALAPAVPECTWRTAGIPGRDGILVGVSARCSALCRHSCSLCASTSDAGAGSMTTAPGQDSNTGESYRVRADAAAGRAGGQRGGRRSRTSPPGSFGLEAGIACMKGAGEVVPVGL